MGETIQSLAPAVFAPNLSGGLVTPIDRLYVDNVSFALSPGVSTAVLSRRYGLYGGANMETVSPLDLRDQILVVKHPDIDDPDGVATNQLFAGICLAPSDSPHGDQTSPTGNVDIPTGDTAYRVYSVDYMLDLVPVDHTFFGDPLLTIDSAIAFNGSTPDGQLVGNRAPTKGGVDNVWYFQSVNSSLWRQSDMVEYLMENIATQSLIPAWTINYGTGILAAMRNSVFSYNPKNKTVRQCLNELISPDRGLAWHCTWPDTTQPPVINIISISDTAISAAGSELLPANADTINLAQDIQTGTGLGAVTIDPVQESIYSQVEVRGEPIRIMTTLKFSSTQLFNNWYAVDETAYKAATDDQRALDKYEPVYQNFSLNENWDYKDHLTTNFLYPQWNVDTGVIDDWIDPAIDSYVDWRFDRSLPLALQNQPSDGAKIQFRKPFLLVLDNGKYYVSDKRINAVKIGMHPADTFAGIKLKAPYNHAAAKTDFAASVSSFAPVYDIDDSLLTCSFYTDQPMSILVEGVTISYIKKKTIYIPGLHLWVARTGTVTDVDADGNLITLAEDTYYRDDRPTLKSLAAFAAAWYGRQRNIVSIEYKSFQPDKADVGQILTTVYSGGSFTVAGTIVSNINYNFLEQSTTVKTDFPSINLPQLYTLRSRRTSAETARDVSMLKSALNDIPLRDLPGSGDENYNGYFKALRTSDTTIKIINGADAASAKAGYATINDTVFNVDVSAELTIAANAFIYLQSIYDPGTEITAIPTFEQSAAFPTYEENKFKRLITDPSFASGKIIGIPPQQQHGSITGTTFGDCV